MYIREEVLKNANNKEKVSEILENYFKTYANYENEHDRDELRRRGFEELKLIGEIQVYQLLMNSDNDRAKL